MFKPKDINHIIVSSNSNTSVSTIWSINGPRNLNEIAVNTGLDNTKLPKKKIGQIQSSLLYPFFKTLENQMRLDHYILLYSYDAPEIASELIKVTSENVKNDIFTVTVPSQIMIEHKLYKDPVKYRNLPYSFTFPTQMMEYTFKPKFGRFDRKIFNKGLVVA